MSEAQNRHEERQKKIDAYRKMRKAQTGRMMTCACAIEELLDAALEHVVPVAVVEYGDLISRLNRLEQAVFDPTSMR